VIRSRTLAGADHVAAAVRAGEHRAEPTTPWFASIPRAARYVRRRHDLDEVATLVLAPDAAEHPGHAAIGTRQHLAVVATHGFGGGELLIALPARGTCVVLDDAPRPLALAALLDCYHGEAVAIAQLVAELSEL
jgi:hypothetical protein